jgi:aromatic-amino-acid transaminase
MRERMKAMRKLLVERDQGARACGHFRLRAQPARHVFLLRPSPRSRCAALRDEFSIYTIDTGRICIAALDDRKRRLRRRTQSRR